MLEKPDFMKKQVLFLFPSQGDKLSFKNDNAVISDKEGLIKYQVTCYRLFALYIVGDMTITTGIVRRAQKFGFVICLMTPGLKLYSTIGNRMEGNTHLHRKQYSCNKSDELSQWIVANKIVNQKTALQTIRKKTDSCIEAISKLGEYTEKIKRDLPDTESLLGIEGSASRIYFPCIMDGIDWKGRKPRIKAVWVNSLMDIGYSVLFNFIDSLLQVYGFDTYCGVYHREFYMRKSLVCDLMEPIRPVIDMRIRKAINLKEISDEDFKVYNHQWQLDYKKSPKSAGIFMEAILEKKEDIFLYIQRYYRNFMKDREMEDENMFLINK